MGGEGGVVEGEGEVRVGVFGVFFGLVFLVFVLFLLFFAGGFGFWVWGAGLAAFGSHWGGLLGLRWRVRKAWAILARRGRMGIGNWEVCVSGVAKSRRVARQKYIIWVVDLLRWWR